MDEPRETPAPPPDPAPEPAPAAGPVLPPLPEAPPPAATDPADEAGTRGRVKRRRRGRRRVPFGEYLGVTFAWDREDEDQLARADWPLAPALIQGAVRGGIAGTLLMAFALGVSALEPALAAYPLAQVALAATGLPLGAAVLGIADALSARLPRRSSALARFVGGLFAPATVLVPSFSWLAAQQAAAAAKGPAGTTSSVAVPALLVTLVVSGIGLYLGLAFAFVGRPRRGASAFAILVRALVAATVFGALVGVTLAVLQIAFKVKLPNLVVNEILSNLMRGIYLPALVLCVGHVLARDAGRRIGRWLEPFQAHRDTESIARYDREVQEWLAARGRASAEPDPAKARVHLEAAFDRARAALAEALANERLAHVRRAAVCRVARLIFALDRLDAIEALPESLPERELLGAERSRVRGDPAGALAIAEGALAALKARTDAHAAEARVDAYAIMASAEIDLGRLEPARLHLEAVRRAVGQPILERFEAAALLARIGPEITRT
jgi:hypothetical protein